MNTVRITRTVMATATHHPGAESSDESVCHRMLDCLADLPVPVWGHDERRTGEMWNSNSVTAWGLPRSGIHTSALS